VKRVVIVGGGFGGLRCARALSKRRDLRVWLIDRRNYHLFQPLLYQVAMAGLSPSDIAAPIRGLLSSARNVQVVQAEAKSVRFETRQIATSAGTFDYDYLVLAAGAQHTYFGNEHWEARAPGLKNLEQATEIRRRVLTAFERAEYEQDETRRRAMLTFVVVGGGPTGVELAGAIGEMTRFTLAKDFRNINPKRTRIVLIEAGPRILSSFHPTLSEQATTELERLGVQIWTNCQVTQISEQGVYVGEEHLAAHTVLWAAGVKAASFGGFEQAARDRQGRVMVGEDLSLPNFPNIFVVGDQAHFPGSTGAPLPAVASVAIQQGRHVARVIEADLAGRPRSPFRFIDRGQMATIGRRRAVMQRGGYRSGGVFAWFMWLFVHIYFLNGFRHRLFVVLHWCWSYLTFSRGSRLIVEKEWRSYGSPTGGAGTTFLGPRSDSTTASSRPASPSAASPAPPAMLSASALTPSALAPSTALSSSIYPQWMTHRSLASGSAPLEQPALLANETVPSLGAARRPSSRGSSSPSRSTSPSRRTASPPTR
jgi:NADH:ubiquinone reductase (H+-translocating)